jgi:hypothetical protein
MKYLLILVYLIAIGVFTALPALVGLGIYVIGMRGLYAAMCAPVNWAFLIPSIVGTYLLLSFSLGEIVWVAVVYKTLFGGLTTLLKA